MAQATSLHFDDASQPAPANVSFSRTTPVWTTRTPSPERRPLSAISMASSASSGDAVRPNVDAAPTASTVVHPSNLPNGTRSLAGISIRAFCLGAAMGTSLALAAVLLVLPYIADVDPDIVYLRLWRPAFFVSALGLFHFLEFYVTAAHNTPLADVEAFLLTTNGRAYNAAHTGALVECTLSALFLPTWQSTFSDSMTMLIGLGLVVIGQTARTAAMATAGTNFNHMVQRRRNEGHVLVTHGIYARLRHPSYFGFFWWGIGTQLVCGNKLCLAAYTVILWMFFRSRIRREEEYLVGFFGNEYLAYRAAVGVGIPFIS